MDQIQKNKLSNRITYLLVTCVLLFTLLLPLFSVKLVTGSDSEELSSAVTGFQMIQVGLMSEDQLREEEIIAANDVAEYIAELENDGKTKEDIEEIIKSSRGYNKLILIRVALEDLKALKPVAIIMIVAYSALALLALMFVLSILLRKGVMDIINVFATVAVATVTIVSLMMVITLKVQIEPGKNYLICSELIHYFLAIGPVVLAVVEAINVLIEHKRKKVKKEEIITSFTAEEEK